MDYQKAQALKATEEYSVCEIVSGASFINPAQYEQWKQKLNRLKLANPQVTKQSILYAPTSGNWLRCVVGLKLSTEVGA